MNYGPQRCQRAAGRLPTVCGRDEPDWHTVKINTLILRGLFDIVNCILDKPRDGGMVTRASDDNAVGGAYCVDKHTDRRGATIPCQVMRKSSQVVATEHHRIGSISFRRSQGDLKSPLRGGKPRRSSPNAYDVGS